MSSLPSPVTDLTASALLAEARALLTPHSPSPRLDAELLLFDATGLDQLRLLRDPNQTIDDQAATTFRHALDRRASGEPLACILGYKEFWSLRLGLNEATLIPRPETEVLVEAVLNASAADQALAILDLGTGSGAIALALASERPQATITATDISSRALEQARENATAHGLTVTFIESDWFSALHAQRFDVIVSNPPYIKVNDPDLEAGVAHYEPATALFAGADGLECIRKISRGAHDYLRPGGLLAVEHGFGQKESVARLLTDEGFGSITQINDYAGLARVTTARRASA